MKDQNNKNEGVQKEIYNDFRIPEKYLTPYSKIDCSVYNPYDSLKDRYIKLSDNNSCNE